MLLITNLEAFTAFARGRLGDSELARDAVQESLAKAVTAEARRPHEAAGAVTWFYRILRHTVIDLQRRRSARSRAHERFVQEQDVPVGPEEEKLLCACFGRLLPALPAQDRELIERVDLRGEKPSALAREMSMSANAIGVQLHRARRRLRGLLEKTCRVCAQHGCLDCQCAPSDESKISQVESRSP